MKLTAAETLRQQATVETDRRIERDGLGAHHQVQPLLAYIQAHLFDPDLSVQRMQRDCGVRDKAVLTRFRADVGRSPWAYVIDRRIEVAAELLRQTQLKVWQICYLTGYTSVGTFVRAFRNRTQRRPLEYRRQQHSELPLAELAPIPESEPFVDPGVQRETLLKDLRVLQARLDDTCQVRADLPITVSGEQFERLVANRVWVVLRSLDRPAQQRLVREELRFSTPVLFHLLREKSRTEGRKDRQLGVHLSQLALESLNSDATTLPAPDLANLRAQGWSWLGRNYRLAMDFLAAEQAFLRAEEELPDGSDPQVRAELLLNKAALRWAQRRFEDALELANSALPLLRNHGNDDLLIEGLVLRSNIARKARDVETAIPDLAEARELLERATPARAQMTLAIHSSLIDLHILAGDLGEAARCLEAARTHSSHQAADIGSLALLQAQEGRIALREERLEQAAAALEQARETFVALQELAPATLISLDLASIYLRQGHRSEVFRIATEIVPVFQAYKIDSGAFLAGQLLQEAVKSQSVTESLLHRLRALAAEHLLGT